MDQAVSAVVPTHLGFILDGNRRWAKAHGVAVQASHEAGYQALHRVIDAAFAAGVSYVTVYAFSTENWKRSTEEVGGIMKLMLKAIASDSKKLLQNGIRVRFIGRREGLSRAMLTAFEKIQAATARLSRGTLIVCFNYGGKQEIVDAVRQCLEEGQEITDETITRHLYASDVPPLDMVVRTSGEQRLSNFMLWRTDYSELYFLQKPWPEMTKEDVTDIIEEYNRRQRRFGG